MSFRRLIELGDQEIKSAIGDYYYISKSRMDNIILCLENGAKHMKELTDIVSAQQEENVKLTLLLFDNSTKQENNNNGSK